MSVSMKPGVTQFTVMARDASSLASERVMPMRPALAAAYDICPALPDSPTTDEMLTMRPATAFSR